MRIVFVSEIEQIYYFEDKIIMKSSGNMNRSQDLSFKEIETM